MSLDIADFTQNPNQQNFEKALVACAPYYFPPHNLEIGKQLLQNIVWNFELAQWWLNKAIAISYDAKWIPAKVPTMIIGTEFDAMTPFTLFANGERYHKPNIEMHFIKDAGHIPWLEQPKQIKQLFDNFYNTWLLCETPFDF